MTLKDKLKYKLKYRRLEKYWKDQGRKKLFTWVYRYLRLHNDLLDDAGYQEMYDYYRNTLIEYFKRDIKRKNTSDKEYGEFIDVITDMYNKNGAERVNKFKSLVEMLYNYRKEFPTYQYDIYI